MSKHICVIGAGVVGLSTAVRLVENVSDKDTVTIIADKFNTETTSDGAFGLWEPYSMGNTPRDKVKEWSSETYRNMQKLAKSENSKEAGTFLVGGYMLMREGDPVQPWMESALHYHRMNGDELNQYNGYGQGVYFTTYATECRQYLPYLMKKFREKGGVVINTTVHDVSELHESYDTIVICCGLRANELLKDSQVRPIKGQAIRVFAPWLKHFVMDEEFYIIPGANNVILGGTLDYDVYDTDISESVKERIFEGCCKLEPSLRKAEILWDWAGLRPGRDSVRLEKEDFIWHGKHIRVVYNYGHGGAGISLHWGCAKEAVQLALGQTHSFAMEQNVSKL